MARQYETMIQGILEAVGGKENVSSCYHCATRLRFILTDWNKLEIGRLDGIEGVLGRQLTGEQLQVIIGPHVGEVYAELCETTGILQKEAIDENLDAGQSGILSEKTAGKSDGSAAGDARLTPRKLLNNIINIVSESFVPLLPVIISASFLKLLAAILGPAMLNLIGAESDLYILFTFAGDAGFYFLPVFMGYTAARKMGVTPVLGMFVGAIMLHPTLTGLVSAGTAFTVYGIPMTLVSYGSTTIPIILIIWIMSYIEKFFNRFIPRSLRYVFSPLLTILVMLPVALCIVGPLGSMLGSGLTTVLLAIASTGTIGCILVSALGGALWNVLVLCGMHLAYYMAGVTIFIESGSDPLIMTTVVAGTMGMFGMTAGAVLRCWKDSENRNLFTSYLITHFFGGVTEPALFGIGMRYMQPFVGACIGGAAGAVYYGITGASITTMVAASNFLIFTQFAGGTTANFVHGVIGGLLAALVACVYTYLFGFRSNPSTKNMQKERIS